MIVIDDPVIFNGRVAADFRWIIRQQEYEDAARVVVRVIVFDQRADRIFDLDAGDVRVDLAIPDDNVGRLADVDRGVFDAGCQHSFDEHSLAFDRVDAVKPRIMNLQIAEGRVLAAVDGDAVVDIVLDDQILDREIVARSDYRVSEFILAIEDRALVVLLQPADRDVVQVHQERFIVRAGTDFDSVAGNGSVQRGLDRFARVDAQYSRLALGKARRFVRRRFVRQRFV